MSLLISCETCSKIMEDQIIFEFFKQADDLVIYRCPCCKTEIIYDSLEVNKIEIVDWLWKNKRDLYMQIVKEYFKPILDDLID